jgi:hypothetical protein
MQDCSREASSPGNLQIIFLQHYVKPSFQWHIHNNPVLATVLRHTIPLYIFPPCKKKNAFYYCPNPISKQDFMVMSVSPGFPYKIFSLFAFLLLPTLWLLE